MSLAYERSTATWPEDMVLGSGIHNDTSAMEVGMTQKGGMYGKKKSAKCWDKGSGNGKGGKAEKGTSKHDKGQKSKSVGKDGKFHAGGKNGASLGTVFNPKGKGFDMGKGYSGTGEVKLKVINILFAKLWKESQS